MNEVFLANLFHNRQYDNVKNMKQIKKNILYNHDLHLVSNYDKNKPFFIDIS